MLDAQNGLRASELVSLALGDEHLGTGAHVSCLGKGPKQRIAPLTKMTTVMLRAWRAERGGLPADPLFATRQGDRSAATRSSNTSPPTPGPPREAARRASPRT